MLLFMIGIVLGICIGYSVHNFITIINRGIKFNLLGYSIVIEKSETSTVPNDRKKKEIRVIKNTY